MMKINLIGLFPKKTKHPAFRYGLFAGIIIAVFLICCHYTVHSITPTVLSGAICVVGEDVHVEQIVRGRMLAICNYDISLDGENWARQLPLTCNEVGAVIVMVKRPHRWGYDILETMVIVQDPNGQCEGVYGP